jgi:CheY-like chemotaxis protein
MDGYEVALKVRADPALRETRLVAVSGYGQDEDRQRSREVGFDAHLTKPIEFADLERLLARPYGGNGKPT